MSKLYFFYGAMGAAKTAQAIITAYNYEERGMNPLCLKPSTDTRTDAKLWSRLGISRDSLLIGCNEDPYHIVAHLIKKGHHYDAVIVDEVQFFSPKQIEGLAMIADNLEIPVLCYGLRTDFRGHLFDGSARLMALADKISEVKTMCHCGRKATMNARIQDGKMVREGEQILIGGNDEYIALCRSCYFQGKLG